MATSTFAAKITDLVGGTIDDNACDDWMTEGAKEIINQLPANLKAKCSTVSLLNNSATTMDLDAVGEISDSLLTEKERSDFNDAMTGDYTGFDSFLEKNLIA